MPDDDGLFPCADKMRFETLREARASATVALHQHGTKLKAYKCSHCQLWHLSSVILD